jgi:hypothetical protein
MIYIGTGLIAALVSISVGACLIAVLTVGNIQLSYLDPDRYMAVTVREKVGWWMRTRPFQKVADELAALGFVEIGAKTEHLGFIRIAVRVFYNAELRTFAELSSQSFRPRVGLISSLPDGTIIKSAHAWTGAWRGSPVLREYAVHGSLSNRLEEHERQLADALGQVADGSRFAGEGTLADLLAIDRREIAIRFKGEDPYSKNPRDRIPQSVGVIEEHHGLSIQLKAKSRALPAWMAPMPLFAIALFDGWALVLAWVGCVVLLFIQLARRRTGTLRVFVTHSEFRIGSQSFQMSEAAVTVDGDTFVVTDRSSGREVEHRFTDFGSKAELCWLANVITSVHRKLLTEGQPDPPAELTRIVGRAREME